MLVLLLQVAWLVRYGDLAAWYQQVIVFNATIYPRLNREPGADGLVMDALQGVFNSVRRLGLAGWLVLGLPAGLLVSLRAQGSRRLIVPTLLLLLSFLLLRVRHYYWKGLPFDCASFAGLGTAAFLLLEPLQGRARAVGLALAAVAGLLLAQGVLVAARSEATFDYWYQGKAGRMQRDFAEIRRRLPVGSTLLAIPNNPHYFLLSGLPPAYGLLAWGPIPAFFDFPPDGPPRPDNLCQKLSQGLPALIYDRRDVSMYYYEVAKLVPPCVDAIEAAHYVTMDRKNWWVRKDLAGALKGLPVEPGPRWDEEVP